MLHTPLEVTELHHHSDALFPDYKRRVPFGTGTSISYKSVDYRFKNNTDITYQLIIYVTDEYLCGELRSDKKQDNKYHIVSEDVFFSKEKDDYK